MQPSVRLTFSNHKFSLEVPLPDLACFFLNPPLQANLFNAAEIEYLHIVRVSGGLISRRSQIKAREIMAVTAQRHTLFFDTIQRCTAPGRQMEMLSILLAATLTGYFFLRDTHLAVNQFGKVCCQIIFVEFTIETVQPTWCSKISFIFHRSFSSNVDIF
jgi:hypothetical protein